MTDVRLPWISLVAVLTAVPVVARAENAPAPAGVTVGEPVAPAPASGAASPTAPARAGALDAATPRSGRGLAVEEAVSLALRNNPTREAARLAVVRAEHDVQAEEGRYPYVLGADAGHTRATSARLGPGNSITSGTSHSTVVGASLRRLFPNGTNAELRVSGERFEDDLAGASVPGFNASTGYAASARASIVHPLARGAGRRVGEAELRAARVSRQATDREAVRTSSEVVRDVLLAYWELWYADESVRIESAALELARQREREARARVEQGALALADVFSYATNVAALEESLVSARTVREQRALDLALLLGAPEDDAGSMVASSELPAPEPLSSRAAVTAAVREGSIELAELEASARLAAVRAEVAGESARPRVDLEAFVEAQGIGETPGSALERVGGMRYLTAHVGIVAELPLDRSRERAERASAALAVKIAEQQLKAARDRIAVTAGAAVANEAAALERVRLAERTLELAQKTYEAEEARFQLGQSIPLQVQEAQDELRRAKLRLARARVDLVQQQIAIQHLTGALAARYALGKEAEAGALRAVGPRG